MTLTLFYIIIMNFRCTFCSTCHWGSALWFLIFIQVHSVLRHSGILFLNTADHWSATAGSLFSRLWFQTSVCFEEREGVLPEPCRFKNQPCRGGMHSLISAHPLASFWKLKGCTWIWTSMGQWVSQAGALMAYLSLKFLPWEESLGAAVTQVSSPARED